MLDSVPPKGPAFLFASAMLAALALALAACGDSKPAAPPQAVVPAVGVHVIQQKGVSDAFVFVGRIKAKDTVDLRARVQGFLEKQLFREGQDVKEGDLLYQIEKVQFQALVDQAKANVAAAEANATNAQLQFNRQAELGKREFTPQANVDQAKAALETAKAQVLQTQAALTQAQVNLGYTDIKAPIDGKIGRTSRTVGNLLDTSSGVLATIVSQDPMYVLLPVSMADLETIRQARREPDGSIAKIEIRVSRPNGKEYPERGLWDLTDPQVNQQTDTITMRATIPNPNRELVDGEFVNATIRERKAEPRLVVPQAALQYDQGGYYALVVDDQHKVEQRRISTGVTVGTDVVVASGLREGEKVIVEGVQKVRPGQTVSETVVTADAAGTK